MTALYWVVDCLATLVECIGCCAFTGIFVEKKNVKKRILVDSTFFSIFIIMMNKISLFSSLNWSDVNSNIGILTGGSL